MKKNKKLPAWHPTSWLRVAGPFLMIAAFAWTGVRLLAGGDAAVVPSGAAQLYMSPATTSVVQGQQISIAVRVNSNGLTLNAVRADMTYDATALEFIATTNPCLDPPFGVTAENLPAPGTTTPGSVKIACGSFNGFSGDHAVATLTFRALKNSGNVSIAFADSSEALQKSDSSNQLGATVGAVVTLLAQPPTIVSVSPQAGSSLGGTVVTITGTNFVGNPTVRFGNANATNVSRVSDTAITATAPAGAPGVVNVSVTLGNQVVTKAAAFSYQDTTAPAKPATPTVSSIVAGRLLLAWQAAADSGGSGIAGYNVYRNGTKLNTSVVSGTTYTDTTAVANVLYAYTIVAVDNAGNSSLESSSVTVTPRLGGDIDSNGAVNLTDLSILLSNWGRSGNGLQGDVDKNNIVNLTDLSILLSNWGK